MTKELGKNSKQEAQRWIRTQLDAAVLQMGADGVFDNTIIEVKPVWSAQKTFLLGKAREQGDMTTFRWFICGEVPLDSVPANVAATPREAARHFALKWQLEATRVQGQASRTLVRLAEHLYALTDNDPLWSDQDL